MCECSVEIVRFGMRSTCVVLCHSISIYKCGFLCGNGDRIFVMSNLQFVTQCKLLICQQVAYSNHGFLTVISHLFDWCSVQWARLQTVNFPRVCVWLNQRFPRWSCEILHPITVTLFEFCVCVWADRDFLLGECAMQPHPLVFCFTQFYRTHTVGLNENEKKRKKQFPLSFFSPWWVCRFHPDGNETRDRFIVVLSKVSGYPL